MKSVTIQNLPAVTWGNVPVITTEYLAKLYGSSATNIKSNFNYNKTRFVEGKHYFRLTGSELKEFKSNKVANSDPVTNKRAKEVILWTERGAARHAKMLETDTAWEVFETLEDCYFTQKKAKAEKENNLSTVSDRMPLYYFTIDTVLRHRLLFSRVYLLINLFAGSKRFKDMTKDQAAEVIDFCDRFALQQDTRADWQRIVDNQKKLYGEPRQLDMVQKLLLSEESA